MVANVGFVTASRGWHRDDAGNRLYHRIDRYADEWAQTAEWAGVRVIKWHRPLASYMQAYLRANLLLREFVEPVPPEDAFREDPNLEDWYGVPIFNVNEPDDSSGTPLTHTGHAPNISGIGCSLRSGSHPIDPSPLRTP